MRSLQLDSTLRTRRHGTGFTTLAFALSSAFVYACYSSEMPATDTVTTDGGTKTTSSAGADSGSSSSSSSGDDDDDTTPTGDGGSGTSVTTSDLPCDIEAIVETNCTSCHGSPLKNGAPVPLLTHADFAASSKSDPSITVAASALAHLTSTTDPMPPAPAAPLGSGDIATFQTWVNAGFPAGSCVVDAGTGSTGDDASSGDDSGNPVADSGPIVPVCTSGKTWTGGSHGSALMHPGRACLACHAANNGPSFNVAGTVFPTLHEPDDCDGANLSGSAYIDIIDAKSVETKVPVDTVGNFHMAISGGIAMPFSAGVVNGTKTRKMTAHQTSADCNGCHTVDGANGAPGRIMAP